MNKVLLFVIVDASTGTVLDAKTTRKSAYALTLKYAQEEQKETYISPVTLEMISNAFIL